MNDDEIFKHSYRSLTGNPDETVKHLYESLTGNSARRKKEDPFGSSKPYEFHGILEKPFPLELYASEISESDHERMNDDEALRRLLYELIIEALKEAYKTTPGYNPSTENPFPEKYFREVLNDPDELKRELAKRKEGLIKENNAAIPTGPFEEFYRQEKPFPQQNFREIEKFYGISSGEEPRQKKPDGLEGKL